jgi:hypothetical protein
MGRLTSEQRNAVRDYLYEQGLTFKPLLNDIADHLSCELEERMQEGLLFADAFNQSRSEIPPHHFQQLQSDTMETIDKRFIYSRVLSWIALGLLFLATAFKVLHFPGAPEFLIAGFTALAASLLSGSLSGIIRNSDKKGAFRLLALVSGVILLLTSFTFTVLRLPGNEQLTLLAVFILIIAGIVNSLHVYGKESGNGNLLTWLHEKYSPGIERFLLMLFFPLAIFKFVALFSVVPRATPSVNLTMLVVIYGAGLQFIAMVWRSMEKNQYHRNLTMLMGVIVGFALLNLPFATSILPVPWRAACVIIFSVVAAWLANAVEEKPVALPLRAITWLFPVIFIGWGLLRMNVLPEATKTILFNWPILLILFAGIFLSRKNGAMKAYMILSTSSYMFEYML